MDPALQLGIKLGLPGIAVFRIIQAHSELMEVKVCNRGKFRESSSSAFLTAFPMFTFSDFDVEKGVVHGLWRELGSVLQEWKYGTHTMEINLVSPIEDRDCFRSNLTIEC